MKFELVGGPKDGEAVTWSDDTLSVWLVPVMLPDLAWDPHATQKPIGESLIVAVYRQRPKDPLKFDFTGYQNH